MRGCSVPSNNMSRGLSISLRVLAVCGLLTITVLTGCSSKEPNESNKPNNPNLYFRCGKCDEYFDESVLGVQDSQWTEGNILVVKALVSLNCAERILWGDYKLRGDTIELEYKSTECGGGMFAKKPCAECNCAHELDYRITGLEHRSYRFELVRLQ